MLVMDLTGPPEFDAEGGIFPDWYAGHPERPGALAVAPAIAVIDHSVRLGPLVVPGNTWQPHSKHSKHTDRQI